VLSLLCGSSASGLKFTNAQDANRVHRIGILFARSGRGSVPDQAFRAGLNELGYDESTNMAIEFRSASGRSEHLRGLAEELVSLKVDLIFAPVPAAITAVLQVSDSMPVVVAAMGYDPLHLGLVASAGTRGGNVTGAMFDELPGNVPRIRLLSQVIPEVRHVALLVDSDERHPAESIENTIRDLGISCQVIDHALPSELEEAFSVSQARHPDALIILVSAKTYARRKMIARFASDRGIPTMASFSEFAEAGGLLSYGGSVSSLFHYAARYADEILRGREPRGLPVKRLPNAELCVNMKTAAQLRLSIPQPLLAHASHVLR
jgi:putative ABC transport system substrate-binding protein